MMTNRRRIITRCSGKFFFVLNPYTLLCNTFIYIDELFYKLANYCLHCSNDVRKYMTLEKYTFPRIYRIFFFFFLLNFWYVSVYDAGICSFTQSIQYYVQTVSDKVKNKMATSLVDSTQFCCLLKFNHWHP